MKTSNKVRMGVAFIVLAVGMIFTFAPNQVSAKGTDGYYLGSCQRNVKDKDKTGVISKVIFKNNKMIVYGSLRGGEDLDKMVVDGTWKYYKNKKRSFQLSKKVKFYSTGGTGPIKRLKKKNFIKSCKYLSKHPNGIGFEFQIKKGKVVKCEFAS